MMKLYTKQELSELAGHTISKLNHDRTANKLGGQRVGRSVVFTQREVNAYLKGQKPPQVQLNLHSTRQAAQLAGCSPITVYRMVEGGRVEPYTLGDGEGAEYLFDDQMIEQIKEAKFDPGRQVIDDGAYDRVRKEDGRWHIANTTGRDGKPLNYKTQALAVQQARRAIREPLQYEKDALVYARAGTGIVRAVMQQDMTAICLAAWILVNGTPHPILVQKRDLHGLVNEEVLEHLRQHNYIIIKGGENV